MKIKKDDIKTIIIVVAVCLLCVILVLILNIKSNVEKFTSVDEYGIYFSKVNEINSYINYVASGDSVAVYNLLDKKYIEDNIITYDNVLEYVDGYSVTSFVNIKNMDYVKIGNNVIYYIKGRIYDSTFEKDILVDDDFSIVMLYDYDNLSYSLYPINDNYKEVINGIKDINIDGNQYNKIKDTQLIEKEQVCVIYYSDFINRLDNNIEELYTMLDKDMLKRFRSVDSFKKYIDENYGLISALADQCRMQEIEDNRVYTVIDSNKNMYIFTEESIMNYKVEIYFNES